MKTWETLRQVMHLSGLVVILIAYFLGDNLTGILSIAFGIFLFFLSYYVKIRNEIRKKLPIRVKKLEELEDIFFEVIESLAKERSEYYYVGAILFFISSGISLIIFPEKIAFISVTILAVGDSLSTFVGVHWGRHKTMINPRKSYEGTVGGFLSSFLVCLIFTNPIVSFVASLIGATVELLPIKINDNLLIPISVGLVLLVMKSFGIPI
ncbi:MAG: phosphatidate cytidylyltransferase [Candidatus Aenigmarchaeota archaeon]|nr:phosphatidate cytidylyltransferase [Candidatus Aenigmarchaeota archaeon]